MHNLYTFQVYKTLIRHIDVVVLFIIITVIIIYTLIREYGRRPLMPTINAPGQLSLERLLKAFNKRSSDSVGVCKRQGRFSGVLATVMF